MSNAKHETLADIVKELREIKGGQHTNGGLSFERWLSRCQFADDYAERIKAAHHREVAELRNGISELLDALQKIYDEECTDYGTGWVYDRWRKALGEEGDAK